MECLGQCPALFELCDSRFEKELCSVLDIMASSRINENERTLACSPASGSCESPHKSLVLSGPQG